MKQILPMISIGVPVYNGADYVQEALDSLLSQTYIDFELIISDNASTDNTPMICEEYAKRDQRIHYIRQSENIGAVKNFKFVLDRAQAKMFMWAAHDDLWSPDYLANAIKLLADESVDFVFPTFRLKSISFLIEKIFDPEIFRFIESTDRKTRVLNFIALHFLSHSANIVYSLFRTEFIRKAWICQDVGNDGVLGAVLLGRGRGALNSSLFFKRYPTIWPGALLTVFSIVAGWVKRRDVLAITRSNIATARQRLLNLFSEYEREINMIYDNYHPVFYGRRYRVCSIESSHEDSSTR